MSNTNIKVYLLAAFIGVVLMGCSKNSPTPSPEDPEKVDSTKYVMDGFDSKLARTVTVSSTSTGIKLKGMGVELDPHFLSQNVTRSDGATEADWTDIVVKRCRMMKVQRFRVMVLPHWWEPYNDDDDPQNFNWEAFTFDNKEMKSLYAVLDMAQEQDADVTLVLWGCPINASTLEGGYIGRHFLADDGTNWVTGTCDNEEFAENYAALVKYLLETKGYTCIKEITPYNEPNGNVADITSYIKTCTALDTRFKNEGIRDKVSFNLSDNTDGAWTYLATCAQQLKKQADFFNSHTYIFGYETPNSTVLDWESQNVSTAKSVGKVHFVGEFGSNQCTGATRQTDINKYQRGVLMCRHVANFLNAGACGASYWSLIDQYYGKNESYMQMQQLGLWLYKLKAYQYDDKKGYKRDYQPRPQYYAYSMATRFIRRDAEVFPLDLSEKFVAGTAVCNPDGKWTYMIANGSSDDKSFVVKNTQATGLDECHVYVYSQDSLPSDDSMISSSRDILSLSGGFHMFCPANSVIILTQLSE